MRPADIVIGGAGVIGLSLALELRQRGHTVLQLDSSAPGPASSAAAGMLAAHDPANPPELRSLARLSLALYPDFLRTLRQLTGTHVPFETEYVLEHGTAQGYPEAHLAALAPDTGPFHLRPEQSVDPRKLLPALRAAGANLQQAKVLAVNTATRSTITVHTGGGPLETETYIDCTGAWAGPFLRPAKGQMLRVQLPPDLLHHPNFDNVVLRTPEIYIVPRLDGTALIGATVEDAGFSTETDPADLYRLRTLASDLIPALADAQGIESWAGLRPRTADLLPLIGQLAPRHYVATGHYRNGILLAPATARVMAQLLHGERTDVPLQTFAPQRFNPAIPQTDLPITAHA